MQFEWDECKRRANLAKHGVDVGALAPMFAGNLVEDDDTRREYGERRIKAIGELNGIIISVVYTGVGTAAA